ISQGSYGIVYRARDKKTGQIVAMKQEFHGFSLSTLREIDILKSLPRHPSIVELKEVVVDDCGRVFVVMDYLQNDLKRFMDVRKKPLTLIEVKCLMKQLLEGVKFLHENGVMHRDLKPSNILMNDKGQLKICDFGLSRHFESLSGSYTPGVVTLWYRAPELLLGANEYSCAIDMWSVGCIMAELMLKEVFFKGRSELHQLGSIYLVLGTPDDAAWPGFSSLIGSRLQFVSCCCAFSGAPILTERGFDLLGKLLTYDPHKRITAEAALNHDCGVMNKVTLFFNAQPYLQPPSPQRPPPLWQSPPPAPCRHKLTILLLLIHQHHPCQNLILGNQNCILQIMEVNTNILTMKFMLRNFSMPSEIISISHLFSSSKVLKYHNGCSQDHSSEGCYFKFKNATSESLGVITRSMSKRLQTSSIMIHLLEIAQKDLPHLVDTNEDDGDLKDESASSTPRSVLSYLD
ncbi:hypothetical protein Pfo_011693, partial [Paulownia fortunei]